MPNRKFPQNVGVLRILEGELLKPVFDKSIITSMEDLEKMLTKILESSRAAKLWVMCFIRPIFTINTHIIADKETDWALHLAMEGKIYLHVYMCGMNFLPQDKRIELVAGSYTMHHKCDQLDGIGSDMTNEVTFVRFGHSKRDPLTLPIKLKLSRCGFTALLYATRYSKTSVTSEMSLK